MKSSNVLRRDLSRRHLMGAGLAGAGLLGFAPFFPLRAENHGVKTAQDAIAKGNIKNHLLRIAQTQVNPDDEKTVTGITINGSLPGPEIRMKEGEIFRARVENDLPDQATTLHWHGLLVPSVMDGVPDVSNPPIQPKHFQVYEYPILQSGTYWYHSHVGLQEQLGQSGPYIIEPKKEPLAYDREYVIFLSDWLHTSPYKVLAALQKGRPEQPMDKGKPDLSDVTYNSFLMNGKGNANHWSGVAKRGDRIRLRIIGGATSTLFRVMLDKHKMTVVHADGKTVSPVIVDNLLIGMGETYDVIVTMGQGDKSSESFTLRAMAQDGSGQAIGVLHTPNATPKANLSKPVWGPKALAYSDLRAAEPAPMPEGQLTKFDLTLRGNMAKYQWSINDQLYPKADRLIIHPGDRVQVTMHNKTGMWHPMHLHGHFFRLSLPGVARKLLPFKSTVNVAPQESLTFEFYADNPGEWIFHCHNIYHLEGGMGRVFSYRI